MAGHAGIACGPRAVTGGIAKRVSEAPEWRGESGQLSFAVEGHRLPAIKRRRRVDQHRKRCQTVPSTKAVNCARDPLIVGIHPIQLSQPPAKVISYSPPLLWATFVTVKAE